MGYYALVASPYRITLVVFSILIFGLACSQPSGLETPSHKSRKKMVKYFSLYILCVLR